MSSSRPARWTDDRGSGTLLGLAVIGATLAALALGVPLYSGLGARQSVNAAADTSVLAAADVASGILPGSPCVVASQLASANRARLDACAVDGLVVTVRLSTDFEGLSLTATATAGPPTVGTN